jgi:threonine dehydrogenase-like Zn-dependent dehydrogenase
MRAVCFNLTIPRYLLGRALGRVSDAVVFGLPSGVRLAETRCPDLPGPEWAELEVIACGICGTDLGNLTYKASPVLEPFASFPAVLGHEVLARVVETGSSVTRVSVGQRVVVDPLLSCAVRGHPVADNCPSCLDGLPATCARSGEAGKIKVGDRPMSPGITIGYHRDLPGGWAPRMVVHERQLYPVPDAITDHQAVLVEPLSVSVHAVLRARPASEEPVLVIGSGAIALSAVWALRALGHRGPVVAQAKRANERDLALRLGADVVVAPGVEAREALLRTGAKGYRPLASPEVYAGGGYPVIIDCVGSRASLNQSLRSAAPRGRVVMLGCAAMVSRLDCTLLWAREIAVQGFVGYGQERWEGASLHTFEITLRLLEATDAPVADMVTHTYPLERYRTALAAARHRLRSGAIKVVLTPSSNPPTP